MTPYSVSEDIARVSYMQIGTLSVIFCLFTILEILFFFLNYCDKSFLSYIEQHKHTQWHSESKTHSSL